MKVFQREVELFPYQQDYLNTLKTCLDTHPGILLCLDTGMGKTYIAAKFIQDVIKENTKAKILILVRKKNLYDPWGNLFGEEKVLINETEDPYYLIFTKQEADEFRSNKWIHADFTDFNVIIVNYDRLVTNLDDFRYIKWDYAIYDEVHEIGSNEKELLVLKSLSNLDIKKQIGLTASPIRNSIKELYILNSFILDNKNIAETYKLLNKIQTESQNAISEISDEFFREQLKKARYSKGTCNGNQIGTSDTYIKTILAEEYFEAVLKDEIKKYLGITIFYHSKRDKKLPQLKFLITRNIYIPLLFSQSAQNYMNTNGLGIFKLWKNKAQILETSPMAESSRDNLKLESPEMGISTKEVFLIQLVKHILEKNNTDDKIVIFSQYTTILAYFLRKLQRENIACIYIDGKTKGYLEKIDEFRNSNNKNVILCSIEAFKEGIDLRCANHVIFTDLPYNPQVLLQAKDRCHRTGQSKNVFVYYLIYHCDFLAPDEIRMTYLKKKNDRFESLFGTDSDGNRFPELIVENYKFSYSEKDEQESDMQNNYEALKTMFDFVFMTHDFTRQFDYYNTDALRTEGKIDRFGICCKYSTVPCYDKEDLLESPYDDINFSEQFDETSIK